MLGRGTRMRLSEDQSQPLATKPGDDEIRLVEPSGNQQRIVRPLLKLHHHLSLRDRDLCRGVDQVQKQMPGLSAECWAKRTSRRPWLAGAGRGFGWEGSSGRNNRMGWIEM